MRKEGAYAGLEAFWDRDAHGLKDGVKDALGFLGLLACYGRVLVVEGGRIMDQSKTPCGCVGSNGLRSGGLSGVVQRRRVLVLELGRQLQHGRGWRARR